MNFQRSKQIQELPNIQEFSKFPKISKEFPTNSYDFENIQFPTRHLEAENPFGLVFLSMDFEKKSLQKNATLNS